MHHHPPEPLCTLRIADSIFLGYVCTQPTLRAIENFRQDLVETHHPDAAHVPYAASVDDADDGGGGGKEGYDDDDEPTGSHVGMTLLRELNRYKKQLRRQSTIRIRGGSGNSHGPNQNDAISFDLDSDDEDGNDEEQEHQRNDNSQSGSPVATAIIIVRYFQKRLLGVTCGRLRSVYERTARLALHRHLNGKDTPFVERYSFSDGSCKNLYGLGAGDTELMLNVVPLDSKKDASSDEQSSSVVEKLLDELQFEGMVGSKNELLPRLQNLQADLPIVDDDVKSTGNNSIMPVYRYPGNYSGTEWPTHPWSPTSLSIKRAVEEALQPLYVQHMNHCVTNLYRDGSDRIDRHSDKDLDLNREGVIVSVSLGSKRVMEVRDRTFPHDVCKVELPSNSMFVLGPYTNARFTHAILPMDTFEEHQQNNRRVSFYKGDAASKGEEISSAECSVEGGGRISLTFRDVRTFLDAKTQRLFGQGISSSSSDVPPLVVKDDGVIAPESLSNAVQFARSEDKRERNSAIAIALAIGTAAGYSSSKSSSTSSEIAWKVSREGSGNDNAKSDVMMALVQSVFAASASYWYLRRARRQMRQEREEKEARIFFSNKSASGNKY